MEKKITDSIFDKKLLAYSLAAGAVLSTAQDIKAQRAGLSIEQEVSDSYNILYNGEIKFQFIKAGGSCQQIVPKTTGAGVVANSIYVKPLNAGVSINSAGADGAGWVEAATGLMMVGSFGNRITHYVGVKFKISGTTHYGWIRCSIGNNYIYLNDWAYETTGGSITTDGVLPVELTSFNAAIAGSSVSLKWNTATEINNHGFEIERKTAANAGWEKIGFVEGHGNSNSPLNYSYADAKAPKGSLSYRLKQIDNDGKYTYSSIVEVANNIVEKFELAQNYPNPFNPSTKIKFSLPEKSAVSLRVFNSLGQEVSTLVNGEMEAGTHEASFNASGLPSGIYVCKISAGKYSAVRKMMMIK
ncbi:MAG: T9SS type A sorting domain-containing protein [Bacteroidota bacterium]